MRLAWVTDIHINFVKPGDFRQFLDSVAATQADAYLVSGDIGEAPQLPMYLKSLADAWRKPVYFVLGNHDYYKSTFARVTETVRLLAKNLKGLTWLNDVPFVPLTPTLALVGHDGWADGRCGDYANSRVELADFTNIEDFAKLDRAGHLRVMQERAQAAADHLRTNLAAALDKHTQALVVTHIPPFAGAAWHEGKPSEPDWQPFFASQVAGEALLAVMQARPDRSAAVLCGHTHSGGVYQPLPNLTVYTGAACYGAPTLQQVFDVQ